MILVAEISFLLPTFRSYQNFPISSSSSSVVISQFSGDQVHSPINLNLPCSPASSNFVSCGVIEEEQLVRSSSNGVFERFRRHLVGFVELCYRVKRSIRVFSEGSDGIRRLWKDLN